VSTPDATRARFSATADLIAAQQGGRAVELAARLSTERSGEFVNGVLDALAKSPPHSNAAEDR